MRFFLKKKHLFALLVLAVMALVNIDSYAVNQQNDEVVKLTRNDAIEMAIDNSYDLNLLDQNIDDLWNSYNEQVQRWNFMKQQLETIDDYQKLIDKKNRGVLLDELEQIQFDIYFAMYGVKPPQLAPVDEFYNYIKVGDFPCQQIYNAVDALRIQKSQTEASIKSYINELFENLLQMKNELTIQKMYYANSLVSNEQMHKKYDVGLISEFELISSDIGIKEQKLAIDMLSRNIDNVELILKSKIGLPLSQKIVIEPSKSELTLLLHSSYKYYLSSALENRAEVKLARNNLKLKQRELDVIKQYFPDERLTERIEAQIAVDEAESVLKKEIDRITSDISRGYTDVISKYNDVLLVIKSKENAQKQYNNAELYYNNGSITFSELQYYSAALKKSDIDYSNAIYLYNKSVRKIKEAAGIGPAYYEAGGLQ